MKLKYTGKDKIVIGSHTQAEHQYQLANHYNMVSNDTDTTLKLIYEFRSKFYKGIDLDMRMALDKIEHHVANIRAQHFNEGIEIKEIKVLDITIK